MLRTAQATDTKAKQAADSREHTRRHLPLSEKYMLRASVRMRALNVGILVAGLVMLSGQSLLRNPFAEIVRDAGIALLIAAIVTMTYEAYARERFAVETLEELLGKLIGDIVERRTWDEIRQQILEKTAIRRETAVHLKLGKGDERGRFVLWTLMEYRLCGLRSRREEVPVVHWLDQYMKDDSTPYPRFIHIEVDGVSKALPTDRYHESVQVGPREAPGKQIVIEREELVHVPGAYTLVMSELTELETIDLWSQLPPGIKVQVSCHMKDEDLHPDVAVMPRRVLLPGQCVEIRFFLQKDDSSS